ncbi:MAG: hypothetical protein NZL93_01155, partial [Chthoniobacterales bacterium]|nr:hypothetical protein [Chthoniobacterales bacterium]
MARLLVGYFFVSFFIQLTNLSCQEVKATVTPQGPEVSDVGGRAEILLNGVWQFTLASDVEAGNQPPSTTDWGLIRVPGSWFPERRTFGGIIEKKESWKLDDNANFAWYRREIEIPPGWTNREIFLEIERVSTDAKIWLNGKLVGNVNWPGGKISLTPHIRPGQKGQLDIFVSASTKEIDFSFMGIGQDTARVARLQSRGIIGDVSLLSLPKHPRIDGVFIQTSVSRKELTVDIEVDSPTANIKTTKVTARAIPVGEGDAIEFPEKELNFEKQGEFYFARVSWPWENAKLWDYKAPNLYDLEIKLNGEVINDIFRERFGFREWKIEGRKVFLNGIEYRPQVANIGDSNFFPYGNVEAAQAEVELLLNRNIGLAWMWPENYFLRGRPFWQKNLVEAADQKGLPMVGNLIRLNEYMRDANFRDIWANKKDAWQKAVTQVWREFRNHPSIVGWILSGNVGPRHQDQNPVYIGRRGWHDLPELQGLREAQAFFKNLDPTRFILFGAAAYEGDIYSAMTYLNFTPLQEREEWLSDWVRNGEMPYVAIEFGTPLNSSFMRGRKGFRDSGETEPLIAEFSAIYLGPQAYKLESQRYRRQIRTKYLSGEKFQSFNFDEAFETDPAFQAIQELFIRNTWRSWRAHNSGWVGMIAWHTPNFYRPNPRVPDVPI